ncbi:recombinase family protein [Cohnella kolymensis]|uniref:recombinase family protein n=1 Tax=Cohnella kolymensis TaxID=1590652 RepID=UPI0006961F8B|nr:recombinase family protein [Cohnella kolymensis]
MKVAIYVRVSTEEQANEGYSIRAQKNQLVDYCRVNEYEISNIYIDEGISAKDTNRPDLQKLLAAAKEGAFDAVLVYKLDRFTRSVKDLYELLEYLSSLGIGFISRQEKFDTTTAMGRAMIGILGVFAQFERELIAERVRFGMEQKVREGKRPGGKVPFGYDKNERLIEEEAEQIRMVRRLYMGGLSYQSVAVRMTRDGHKRRKYDWTATTVMLTLENAYYAGIIRYGTKMPNGKYAWRKKETRVKVLDVEGSHEPIWTVNEYEEHIARMRRRSVGGNGSKHDYWFNGVLRCGRCGAAMYGKQTTRRTLKSGKEVTNSYYWCSRRKDNKSCNMPMFRESHVTHLIMEHIEKIRLDHMAVETEKKSLKKQEDERKQEASRLKRELDKIRARIKKWQYAFAEDLITDSDLKKRMNEEKDLEAQTLSKLHALETSEESDILDRLVGLTEQWTSLDDADKNELITTVFEKITLHTDEVNVKGVKNAFFPASIEVEYK